MAETKKEQKAIACGAHCSGAGSSRMLSWHKTYHVPDFFPTQGRTSKALLSFWPHKQQAVMTPVSTRTFRALSRTMYVQSCTLIPADDAAGHGPIHHSGCCRQRSCPCKKLPRHRLDCATLYGYAQHRENTHRIARQGLTHHLVQLRRMGRSRSRSSRMRTKIAHRPYCGRQPTSPAFRAAPWSS